MSSKDLASDCPIGPSLFVGVILLLIFHCFVLFSSFSWCGWYVMIYSCGTSFSSVTMLNNLNINSRSMRSSASLLSGLSLISPYDWYSGGRVFDPRYIFRRDLVMR